jgi:hypothetical protein
MKQCWLAPELFENKFEKSMEFFGFFFFKFKKSFLIFLSGWWVGWGGWWGEGRLLGPGLVLKTVKRHIVPFSTGQITIFFTTSAEGFLNALLRLTIHKDKRHRIWQKKSQNIKHLFFLNC